MTLCSLAPGSVSIRTTLQPVQLKFCFPADIFLHLVTLAYTSESSLLLPPPSVSCSFLTSTLTHSSQLKTGNLREGVKGQKKENVVKMETLG